MADEKPNKDESAQEDSGGPPKRLVLLWERARREGYKEPFTKNTSMWRLEMHLKTKGFRIDLNRSTYLFEVSKETNT